MYNYDFKQVATIIGAQQAYGFAEGDDVIQVVPDTEDWNLTVGPDGEHTRSKSNNDAATVTLRLQKTSDFNDYLNSLYQNDKLTGRATFPFMIKDNLGRDLHVAEQMWIQKRPDQSHGANVGVNEWVLRTGKMAFNYGGNGEAV